MGIKKSIGIGEFHPFVRYSKLIKSNLKELNEDDFNFLHNYIKEHDVSKEDFMIVIKERYKRLIDNYTYFKKETVNYV